MWFHLIFGVCFLVFNINSQSLGGYCRTPRNEGGKCISVYECSTLLPLIRSKDRTQEQTKFLYDSSCGFDSQGTPYVCCGSNINPISSSGDVDGPYSPNPLIPNRSNCGFQFTNKILNGEATAFDEFPWMTVLEYAKSNGQRRIACGGSLINPNYVLTAAHCVTGEDLNVKVGQLINIRLGEYDTSSRGQDCQTQKGIRYCNKPEVNVGIAEVIPHPRYTGTDDGKLHDIALIKLASPVTYSEFIQPICLPLPTEASSPGDNVIVAGWGKTEKGRNSNVKLKLQIPVTSESQCANAFESLYVRIQNSHICAGGANGKDSCTGDSGGPLMRLLPSDGSRWMLEGIVSFGYTECGTAGYPGVYTKVAKYVPWIHKTVKQ